MTFRIYRPLSDDQLDQLSARLGGGYRYADQFAGVLSRAEAFRDGLVAQGVHAVGVEFEAPGAPETFEVSGGVVGVAVLWLAARASPDERGPFAYAFARGSDGGPRPIGDLPGENAVGGSLFVMHYTGDAAAVTPESLVESLRHVSVGAGAGHAGVVSGQFTTTVPSGVRVFGGAGRSPLWFGFAGSLRIDPREPGESAVRYSRVQYRHFEWLLRRLGLRPGDDATVPDHGFLAGFPQWAPAPHAGTTGGQFSFVAPANPAIVESRAVYDRRLELAKEALRRQHDRAEAMLQNGEVTDYRYWFARVYEYVTRNEIRFVESGTFRYPSYVLASVLYFEKIYEDNFEAHDTGRTVEPHWARAFEVAATQQRRVEQLGALEDLSDWAGGAFPNVAAGVDLAELIQRVMGPVESLVASMQAHIRFDLPRAEAWVFNTHYGSVADASLGDFRSDFMRMSGVFDDAGREMNLEIARRIGVPVDWMPYLLQDSSMRYWFDADMATERADTWRRAEELVGTAGTGPYTLTDAGLRGDVTASDNLSTIGAIPTVSLRPAMEASATPLDGDSVRSQVAGLSDAEIRAIPAVERVRMLRGLYRRGTDNEDEAAILKILRASIGEELVTLVNGADAWDLMYATDGEEAAQLRGIFRAHFYPNTARNEALRLVRKCLDGETAEWEEVMVVDILEDHPDGRVLVEELGRAYYPTGSRATDAAFRNGLRKLEWQLDGEDQDRIEALFGTSSD